MKSPSRRGDRVAQTVAAMALEPRTEAIFHEDSYGYRPRKGALDAVAACRERCWARNWVIDLDVRKFFDSVPWDLMVKAVRPTSRMSSGGRALREAVAGRADRDARRQDGGAGQGDPQGSAIIPCSPTCSCTTRSTSGWNVSSRPWKFERYADDAVVHCATSGRPGRCSPPWTQRMAEVGLQLHPDKTKIVYCKDRNRRRADCADTCSPSWATRSAPGKPRPGTGRACSARSCPRSAGTPSRR